MRDLRSPLLIYLKGVLLLVAGVLAGATLLVRDPRTVTAMLLIIAIWCFARFYYFVFYVTNRYLEPRDRFSGIVSLARHLLRRR